MTISLDKKTSERVSVMLSKLLANNYLVYVKTQNFHWNVRDARFHTLHEFFQEQYEELAEAVDEIAERIRALGHRAPGSMREFLDLSNLDESTENLSGDEMLSQLLVDNEQIASELRGMIKEASDCGDEGSADIMIQRLKVHEKTAWMIRSHLS